MVRREITVVDLNDIQRVKIRCNTCSTEIDQSLENLTRFASNPQCPSCHEFLVTDRDKFNEAMRDLAKIRHTLKTVMNSTVEVVVDEKTDDSKST